MQVAAAFPSDLATLATTRRFVLSVLDGRHYPEELVDAAVLITSELAANAASHADGDAFRITIHCPDDGTVRIEVDDRDDRLPQTTESDDPADWRGLRIVAAYASSWGVTRRASGKTVWVELARTPAGSH